MLRHVLVTLKHVAHVSALPEMQRTHKSEILFRLREEFGLRRMAGRAGNFDDFKRLFPGYLHLTLSVQDTEREILEA
jgi:hypothetical protein